MNADARRKICLFAVLCLLTVAGCLVLDPGVARGATQTLGGVATEGSLYIAVGDTGQMSVARYAGGTWQAQAFSSVPPALASKGSKLYTATYGAQPLGYFPPGSGATATANYVSGNQVVTQWTLSGNIQVTQLTTYTSPNAYYRLDWSVTNLSGGTVTDLRFFHGEDTLLAGGDKAAGWWDGATSSVGAYRNDGGVEQRMSLQGVTAPAHYASKNYGTVRDEGQDNRLSDQLDTNQSVDNGYALEWDLATLGNGSTWSITAYEKFVAGTIGALTVNSPITVDCYAGNSCSITYAVSNPTAVAVSASASVSGTMAWGQYIASPGASFSVPANSTVNVIVPVTVPAGTPAGTTGNFTLTVNDGSMNSSCSTAVVTQVPPNNPPSSTPQSVTVTEDTPRAITLTGSDPDGNPITYTVTSSPAHGTLSGTAPNLTYTPASNYPAGHAAATDSFTFIVTDSNAASSPAATVSITITPVNDPPVLSVIPAQTLLEDTPRTLTVTGTDADGDPLTYSVTGGSADTVSPSLAGNQLTLAPAPAYNTAVPITITVTATDSQGAASSTAFTLTVTPVNDAPSFTKGADQTVLEDCGPQVVLNWATSLSAGPADEAGQTLTFYVVDDTNPALFTTAPAVSSTGTLTYTPAPDANGTAVITFVLQDNGGVANGGLDETAPQTMTITVQEVNDTPTATPDAFTTSEDQTLVLTAGQLLANDQKGPANEAAQTLGILGVGPSPVNCTVSLTGGTLTVIPDADFNGTASFQYTIQDNGTTAGLPDPRVATATVTLTITSVNDVPSFTKGADQTVSEDCGPQTVSSWATGISAGPANEAGQTLSFLAVGNTNPGLFATAPAVSSTGTLTYTPAPDANGTAVITFILQDDGGVANGGIDETPSQTVTLTVTPVNDAPSFTKGADQTVLEDCGPRTAAIWATGVTAGPLETQALTFTVTGNTNPGLFTTQPAVSSTGALTYAPAPNANGTAVITLTLTDDAAAGGPALTTAPQTFTITVTPVNDAPGFTRGSNPTVLEDCGPQTVPAWATAITPGPANEAAQVLSFLVTGNTNPGLFTIQPSLTPDGTLTYTPAPDANGTAVVTVVLHDDGGVANGGSDETAPQTITFTVTPVNDMPSFTKGADQTVSEDCGPQTVLSWATGISRGPANEAAQVLTFTVTTTNDALFATRPAVSGSTGTLTYTPAPDANGTAVVTVVLHDDGGTANGGVDAAAPQTFTLMITPVNDMPSFTKGADQAVLEDCGPQAIPAWATAITPGPANEAAQALTFTVTGNTNPALFATQPAVSSTGALTYTPAPDANGTAVITLTLTDDATAGGPALTTAPQTFTITVTPVNDAPSFTKGPDQTVLEDCGPQTVSSWATGISRGPANEAAQVLHFTVTTTNPALFSIQPAITPDGTLTYTPAPDQNTYAGPVTITVVLHDDGGTVNGGVDASTPQTFTLMITPVNDAPVNTALPGITGIPHTGRTLTGTPGTWNDDHDLVPGALTYAFQWQRSTDGGTTFVDIPGATTGTLLLTPADNLRLLRLRITCTDDGQGLPLHQSTTVFSASQEILNAPPLITDGVTVVTACDEDGSPAPFSKVFQATDADAIDTLTWTIVTRPAHGTLTLPAVPVGLSLAPLYQPAVNWHGTDTFRLRVEDGLTGAAECTVTVVVNPRNDPPVNTVLPAVAGIMVTGNRVRCTEGTWNDDLDLTPGTLTYTRQWVRARNDAGKDLEDIPGATSSAFLLRNTDAGWYVGVRITCTDDGEGLPREQSTSVLSALHPVILAGTTPPTVTFPDFRTLPGVTACSGTDVPSFTTTDPFFALPFTVEDDDSASVHWTVAIGTSTLSAADGAGSFTRPLSLNEGLNDVVVTAVDASGNQACRHLHITLDTHAPAVTLTGEVPQYTSGSVLTLAGSVRDDLSGLRLLSVNGEQVVPYADGTFQERLALKPGENTVVITAVDNAGNQGSRTLHITSAQPVVTPSSSHTMTLTIGQGTLTVDGTLVTLDAPAVLREDRTFVPLRAIVEHLGGTVSWNAKTRQATVRARGVTIVLTLGRNTATVNGTTRTIDPKNPGVVPVLSAGRTLLPLRFVAEQLGLTVSWDAASQTITLSWTD